MPRLTESDLPTAVAAFVDDCRTQLRQLGFDLTCGSGSFHLQLSDDPVHAKGGANSYFGRYWLNRPEFRDAYWPCPNSRGVYLFFDRNRLCRYVGKAESAIGNRIGAHLGARGRTRDYPDRAFPEAAYIVGIPLDEAPFLAPAFESFLLKHYEFPDNMRGTTVRAVPELPAAS